jgi:hypothetical protein
MDQVEFGETGVSVPFGEDHFVGVGEDNLAFADV